LNTVENSVFLFQGVPEGSHDVQGLNEKSTYKGKNQDTYATDHLIQTKESDNGSEKENPVEDSAFFSIFHAYQFVGQIYPNSFSFN
jgi:hypothetical protein